MQVMLMLYNVANVHEVGVQRAERRGEDTVRNTTEWKEYNYGTDHVWWGLIEGFAISCKVGFKATSCGTMERISNYFIGTYGGELNMAQLHCPPVWAEAYDAN